MEFADGLVNYEAFGAKGDGVTDDMQAICDAHEYANTHRLSVRTKPDATYHLGARALTAVITTNTDWNTSRFTLDDTQVEDHKKSLFEVRSLLDPIELQIDKLTRDQKKVDARPERDCHVLVENDNKRLYIRRGLNQNNGTPQHDCFVLRKDGTIDSPIDWHYDTVTRVEAHPIDDEPLIIRGGIFTTFANRMKQDVGYNYWSRNIVISRSNTEIDGLTHYVVGETSVGHPYSGFISVRQCADVTLRNCFATGHKIYSTIGAAGKPVNMGSYDYNANNVVNFSMINCKMNHITDRSRWGVIGSNFCKNILLEDCTLSRMDTHMGVSGSYVIRGCTLGWMGLNAIGRGDLIIEDATLYGSTLVSFRRDYGSTWEGDLFIRNSKWIPACGDTQLPHMINVSNDGMHDFGYPCSMPTTVTIDGLFVDDSNHPEDYQGMYFFTDHEAPNDGVGELPPSAERPYPYAPCQKISVKGLTTASGKKPRVSPNEQVANRVDVIEA
jgi:hypothetical protein